MYFTRGGESKQQVVSWNCFLPVQEPKNEEKSLKCRLNPLLHVSCILTRAYAIWYSEYGLLALYDYFQMLAPVPSSDRWNRKF